jgi:hypothetical protein
MSVMTRMRQRSVGSYLLAVTTTDEEGAPQTVAAATSATLEDGAGAVLRTATAGDLTVTADGMTWAVPAAAMPLLDTYTVTWVGTVGAAASSWTTIVELVGGHLFSIAQLRNRDRAYDDAGKYPDDRLAEVRIEVEDTIEADNAANVAFVPRGRRAVIDGHGRRSLPLPDLEAREVYSATVDGVALTQDELDALVVDDGWLWMPAGRCWPAGKQNVSVHYAHGRDWPDPAIRRAALTLAREYLAPGDLPGRASATTVGDQTFRLTIAGRDGVTGLPEVDAAITQHGRTTLRIG